MLFTAFFLTVTITAIIHVLKLYSEYKHGVDNERTQVATLVLLILWGTLVYGYIDGIDSAAGIYLSMSPLAGYSRKQLSLLCESMHLSPGLTQAVVREGAPNYYEVELEVERMLEERTPEEIKEEIRRDIEQEYVDQDVLSF